MDTTSAFKLRCQEYNKPMNWLKFNLYFRFPLGLFLDFKDFFYTLLNTSELNMKDNSVFTETIFIIAVCLIRIITVILITIGIFKLKRWAMTLWKIFMIVRLSISIIVVLFNIGYVTGAIACFLTDLPTLIYLQRRNDFIVKPQKEIIEK